MVVFNIKYDDKTVYRTLIITQKPIVVNIVSNTIHVIIECDRYKCIIYHAFISCFHENKEHKGKNHAVVTKFVTKFEKWGKS